MCEGLRLTRATNVGSPKRKSLAIADTVMLRFAHVPQLENLWMTGWQNSASKIKAKLHLLNKLFISCIYVVYITCICFNKTFYI